MNIIDIQRLHKQLSRALSNWHPNSHHPPCYIRVDGMGKQVAIVDPWCGGYQRPHEPVFIGWEARGPAWLMKSNTSRSGVILVADAGGKDAAINLACAEADRALQQLGWLADEDTPEFELVRVQSDEDEAKLTAVG